MNDVLNPDPSRGSRPAVSGTHKILLDVIKNAQEPEESEDSEDGTPT